MARIRELEDDVDVMAQQNIELEHHNHQLLGETGDLEQESSLEDQEIQRLNSAVQKAAGGTSFE